MLNFDKYRETILETTRIHPGWTGANAATHICPNMTCSQIIDWLFSEYEPPLLENGDELNPGDWIMVRDHDGDSWDKMMFACYCNGLFFVVDDNTLMVPGFRENGVNITGWRQARLPEDGE